MATLRLTLKKVFFDMVGNGKTEEYREDKPWVRSRLMPNNGPHRKYDFVSFKNGYAADAPEKIFVYLGIEFREGREEWGAVSGKKYWVIKLGEQVK